MPVSHGCHVIEHRIIKGGSDGDSDCDSIVVQREQMENTELWYFGIFDALIGDGVIDYMQSHFFDKQLKEVTSLPYLFFPLKGFILHNQNRSVWVSLIELDGWMFVMNSVSQSSSRSESTDWLNKRKALAFNLLPFEACLTPLQLWSIDYVNVLFNVMTWVLRTAAGTWNAINRYF